MSLTVLAKPRTRAIHFSTFWKSFHFSHGPYPLPWPPLSHQHNSTRSYLNNFAGIFLLKQLAPQFSKLEFLQGVKDAVYTIAEVISDQCRHDELEYLLTKRLYAAIKPSLDQFPSSASIHLDIESLRHLQLRTIEGTIGEAPQEDIFTVKLLGQRLIASEANLEMYSDVFFRGTKEDRLAASEAVLSMKSNFELGVTFLTREKFVVFGKDGQVMNGSNKVKSFWHFWKLSSPVNFEQDGKHSLDWTVSDINDFLNQKHCLE